MIIDFYENGNLGWNNLYIVIRRRWLFYIMIDCYIEINEFNHFFIIWIWERGL